MAEVCYRSLFISSSLGFLLSTCCKLEACFPVRLDPKFFESNDSAEGSRMNRVRLVGSSSRPFYLILLKYVGFILANPDWYEVDDIDGVVNV